MNFFRIPKTRFKKISIEGYKFYIPHDMSWAYSNNRYYETNVSFWISKLLFNHESSIFFDIGANYGYYTVICSPLTKKVFTFEPVSTVFKYLEKNIQSNQLNNITSFNIGLGNTDSKEKINLYSSSGHNSLFKREIPEGASLKHVGREIITIKKLDTLLIDQQLPMPNLVKIDVEGAELDVLRGARETFKKCRPVIIIEYSENTSRDAGYAKDSLINELLNFGDYYIYGLSSDYSQNNLIPYKDFNKHQVANVIAAPTKISKL